MAKAPIGEAGAQLFRTMNPKLSNPQAPTVPVPLPVTTKSGALAPAVLDGYANDDARILHNVMYGRPLNAVMCEPSRTGTSGIDAIESIPAGTYGVTLEGSIENRELMGIGGEAPPSGSYLTLEQPISVEGLQTKDVFLFGRDFPEGASLKLQGRVELFEYGGVETPGAKVVRLTGISNLSAKEPAQVNGQWVSSVTGAALPSVSFNEPMMYDGPGTLFVMDAAQQKAFLGQQGGLMERGANRFGGFFAAREMREPTPQESANIQPTPNDSGWVNANGEPLKPLGEEPGKGFWVLDPASNAAYRIFGRGPNQIIPLETDDVYGLMA